MSDDTQQPIIVKRIKKGGGGHHGGAWKIAYADFVTAMMAFFLLMWLLGSTAQGDLEGIADHFQNPILLSLQGGSGTGDSSSIIQGGGEDLSRSVGQVRRGDIESRARINLDAARAREMELHEFEAELLERGRLLDLKGRIEAMVEANPDLRNYRNQILIDITTDGLRIQLVDEQNRPMFASASADLQPYTRSLLRAIGSALNDVPNRLSLTGHTDALPFAGGERGFSNWELSANRANASRREMIAGGLEPNRIARVVGLAETVPLIEDDPLDPANRRISIIVMTKRAEEALRSGADVLSVEDGGALQPAALQGAQ
ncbi:flagellar motor protein MotB [Azoarcus taiwanensis]|uniref:Flagellar motor protein MotB n=1 Tax=Azoarcus taiwanensis TaxID=666964 RepID=A0A972J7U5_9RHOO|nr:flagellar motor protein MotB [Azoarcus taiwanensis]NMG02469.1 flagellar motor protein MotB [Azoarcus taiwanensis]